MLLTGLQSHTLNFLDFQLKNKKKKMEAFCSFLFLSLSKEEKVK